MRPEPILLSLAAVTALAGCVPNFSPAAVNAVAASLGEIANGPSPRPSPTPRTIVVGEPAPAAIDAKAIEADLYARIDAYRAEHGLGPIPRSAALATVARAHVADLAASEGKRGADCNLHSWSATGAWTPICYTGKHEDGAAMWSKPGELTAYQGNGYEIAFGLTPDSSASARVSAEAALDAWKGSPQHNDVLLNQSGWADVKWQAVGVGINARYAVVWFGKDADTTPASDPS